MKRALIIVLGLVFLLEINVCAQSKFSFDHLTHDFGVLAEDSEAIHSFEFTNTGKDTIVLTEGNIRPGCGCTNRDFTREPIPPGGRGKVVALFGTHGRAGGSFNKPINILYKDSLITTLYIKLAVIKKEAPVSYTEKEKKASAKMVLDAYRYNFGQVEKNKTVVKGFILKNSGKDTLKITNIMAGCSCVTHKLFQPNSRNEITYVLPGKSAMLELNYGTSGPDKTPGKAKDIVTLFTNDKQKPVTTIILEAEIVESLAPVKSIIREDGNSQEMFK